MNASQIPMSSLPGQGKNFFFPLSFPFFPPKGEEQSPACTLIYAYTFSKISKCQPPFVLPQNFNISA